MSTNVTTPTAFCECHRRITYHANRGWVHCIGGGSAWMGCRDCFAQAAYFPVPKACPSCGGELLDLHFANPVVTS